MEFPHLGKHCYVESCKMLDFLPVKCDACSNIFCKDHMTYEQHNCPLGKLKDRQVPICPLCSAPVPAPRNEPPDYAVGAHIDRDCQSDPAVAKRKLTQNKCSVQGCKIKEIIPVLCTECRRNFCIKHRFPGDHKCDSIRNLARDAATKRMNSNRPINSFAAIQGSMSEDEALARALAASMGEPQPAGVPSHSQRCQVS